MAALIKRFPFKRSEAASSVPVTSEHSSRPRYTFPESSPVVGAEILEKNLYDVLRDKFSESEVKQLVGAIHTPIDKNRFSKSETNFPMTFRIKREKNGTIKLFIYGRTLLGSGTFKKVKEALEVSITCENECTARDIVIQRVRKEFPPGMIKQSIANFRHIEKIYHETPIQERFKVGPTMRTHGYQSKDGLYRIELTQIRLDKNLREVMDLTPAERLKVLIDATDGISQIHRAGYVHSDVKPDNIFIDFKGVDNERKAYVGDLDLLIAVDSDKKTGKETKYYAWDHLAENGIFTYNVDLYGLAISAAGAFFPNSFFFNDEKSKLATELDDSPEKILLRLLKKERPSREAFILFKKWYKQRKKKSKKAIYAKIREVFPVELRLIDIVKREFLLSLEYNLRVQRKIKLCKQNTIQIDLKIILNEEAQNLDLTTIESLKSEFVDLLRLLEGQGHAASSVSGNS